VTLVDRRKEGLVPFIEKRAGVKFERIGAPQPQEMAKIAGAPRLVPPGAADFSMGLVCCSCLHCA